MPDFSFPEWMTRTTSFGDSLLKGAQVGAIVANNRYRNQALAAQAIDAERNYALREKALAVEQEQNDVLMKSRMLELDTRRQLIQDQVEDKQTLASWIAERNRTPVEERLTAPLPSFKLPATFEIANRIADNDRMAYEKSIDGQMQSQFAVRVGKLPPSYQRRYRMADSPEEQDRILEEGEAAALKKTFAPGPLEKDIEYYKQIQGEGDPEIVDLVRSTLQAKAQKSGFSVKFGPGGTVESVDYGPQAQTGSATAPTAAVKTDLQKDVNNTRHALAMMGDLEKNLRSQDVGFYGVIGETVMDRLLPQFGTNTLDPKRTDNRTKLRTLVQSMLRQISPDNRFTNEDRERIERIMPDLGVLENVERAKTVLSELSKVFSERNVRDLQALGGPLNMQQMSDEELAAAVRMKLIKREDALQFFRENRAEK